MAFNEHALVSKMKVRIECLDVAEGPTTLSPRRT